MSTNEIETVKKCLELGLRLDGRSLTSRRDFILEQNERLQVNSLFGCRIKNPENSNWIYFSVSCNVVTIPKDSKNENDFESKYFFYILMKLNLRF